MEQVVQWAWPQVSPHNLGEVINATIAGIKDKEITINQLMKHVLDQTSRPEE